MKQSDEMKRCVPDKTIETTEGYYAGVRHEQNNQRIITPGSQYLVQLLKGGYLGEKYLHGRGMSALDVGCGSGYNSISLAQMGWNVRGCEISADIVQHATQNIASYGLNIPIDIGSNEALPYQDNTFDFLLSMSVIHYLQSQASVFAAVEEYARVLKKGGRLFLSTNHPDNWILKNGEWLDSNLVRVNCPEDYRDGTVLFTFSHETDFMKFFSSCFDGLTVGINRFDFFSKTLHHFILTGTRK